MQFLIADTFTDSLGKLGPDEQKAVKMTAFDLQLNPAAPGMRLHKIERVKDKSFWSVRVSDDIRLIVHKTPGSLLLCYVDHHDKAYCWAECRKLETHSTTGAAQLVELRERVQEVVVPRIVGVDEAAEAKPAIFAGLRDEELLGYGVPPEWLDEVRKADEGSVLDLAGHLPAEAAEALLELATGGRPKVTPVEVMADPFVHPDARRRFRIMGNVEELERALEYPWEKWTIFLHPAQRQIVEHAFNGPARVSGSAGTGKTIVALHRAVSMARQNPDARVLIATFSHILANALENNLRRLISNEPMLAERIEVLSTDEVGARLYKARFGAPRVADRGVVASMLAEDSKEAGEAPALAELDDDPVRRDESRRMLSRTLRTRRDESRRMLSLSSPRAPFGAGGAKFSQAFLLAEWEHVVDAWQLESWEAYRDFQRLGRKTRLPEQSRSSLWVIFERVLARLNAENAITMAGMFTKLAGALGAGGNLPFDFVVVDEAQDVSVAQLRFFAALGAGRPDALFFAGDLGQRIFQRPFSWLGLGVDIRGRARTLRVNYRTSHQIRTQADRLLGPEVIDADGNVEKRRAVSVFNGPEPEIAVLNSKEDESLAVAEWVAKRLKEGVRVNELGVFARSTSELERATAAAELAGVPYKVLDEMVKLDAGQASIGTMHLAKGLEFRAVVLMACDDEIIPSQQRIEMVGDDAELQEVYDTERHLLYVACTRARDHLLVTGVAPASEFLDDLRP